MCLINAIVQKAADDVVCYKVLLRKKTYFPSFSSSLCQLQLKPTSPCYYGYVWEEGINYADGYRDVEPMGDDLYRVSGGFLHCYASLEGAREYAHYLRRCGCGCGEIVVYQVTIPKDTEYYDGQDVSFSHRAYASPVLKLGGEIE